MKFLIGLLSNIILGYLFTLFLPWWSVVLVAFLVGAALFENSLLAFGTGFLAMVLLWACYAGWLDVQNGGILSQRVGGLFGFTSGTSLVYLTGAIGGLLGGLGSLTGQLGRSMFLPTPTRYGSRKRKSLGLNSKK